MEWAPSLDEYEKLVIWINSARSVVIDNSVCPTATLVKVDSTRKHGVLLEAVQALAKLDLSVRKAYISSDGRWFMDVFHVTDQHGRKLADPSLLSLIQESLGEGSDGRSDGYEGLTALELTGTDRPGLVSEVFAVLADLECSVAEAKLWTHDGRVAAIVFFKDGEESDSEKIASVESRLQHIVGENGKAAVSAAVGHPERRLHRLMSADGDDEPVSSSSSSSSSAGAPSVAVQNWAERSYSVVTVECRDRPKLLFDVVCTLTDMQYVVFHGTIDTNGERAHQELYVRHSNGSLIDSEAERHRVVQRVRAAIARRASGLRLELCAEDRLGLRADVTRTLRENGLLVTRAEVTTEGRMSRDVFYVTGESGRPADQAVIHAVRQSVGEEIVTVGEEAAPVRITREALAAGQREAEGGSGLLNLGSLVKRNLFNLGLIRSCS